MFKHLKIKKLISEYLDKELTEQQKALVENHLKECPACSKYFQDLQKLGPVLSQYKSEEVSPDLEQKIKNNFLGDKYKEVAKMSKKRLLVGASSGALAILLMFVLVGGMQNYLKRSMQCRMHGIADEIQYSPASSAEYEPATMNKIRARQQPVRTKNEAYFDNANPDTSWRTTYEESNANYSSDVTGGGDERVLKNRALGNEGPIVIVEPYLPATGKEEKIIRNAEASLEVKDVQKVYGEVIKISKDKKGYLAGAEFSQSNKGKIYAKIVMRIPKEKFEETLDEIRKLGEVKNFNIKSLDVSQNYAALVSELNTLKVVYDKIFEKLKEKKTDIEGAISLESEITPIAERLEEIRNKISNYDNLIAMSTITVYLHASSWQLLFQQTLKEAHQKFIEFISNLINGAVELLPAILTILSLLVVVVTVILFVVAIVKKALRKKSS